MQLLKFFIYLIILPFTAQEAQFELTILDNMGHAPFQLEGEGIPGSLPNLYHCVTPVEAIATSVFQTTEKKQPQSKV